MGISTFTYKLLKTLLCIQMTQHTCTRDDGCEQRNVEFWTLWIKDNDIVFNGILWTTGEALTVDSVGVVDKKSNSVQVF